MALLEKEICEGKIRLVVPDVSRPEEGEVFYNPVQALSRDFSIAVYSVLLPKTLCDPSWKGLVCKGSSDCKRSS